MATKKKSARKKVVVSPEELLVKLFGEEHRHAEDRVTVNSDNIIIDEEEDGSFIVSEIDDANALSSCCGVLELVGVGKIAPNDKAAYKAVDTLYTKVWIESGWASVIATINTSEQPRALAYFRATGWKEVNIGKNKPGTQLLMFVKVLRGSN